MTDERLQRLYLHGLAARAGAGAPCAVPPEALLALARGELPEDERLPLLDAVMTSARCREELDLLRAVVAAEREALGDAPAAPTGPLRVVRGDAPSPAAARPWWRRTAVPVALAATALLAVGLSRMVGRGGEEVMRGRAEGVMLVAPAGAIASGPVTLAWRPVPDAVRYAVELLDAQGSPLVDTTLADTTLVVPAALLRAGREYRWIVTARDAAGSERGQSVGGITVGRD